LRGHAKGEDARNKIEEIEKQLGLVRPFYLDTERKASRRRRGQLQKTRDALEERKRTETSLQKTVRRPETGFARNSIPVSSVSL